MAGIPGTNIAAMVVPFDTADIYATHNDKYGRGGFRVCETIDDRNAITELRRKAGMWVRVLSDGKLYELGPGLTNADWIEVHLGGSSSTIDVTYISGTTHVIIPEFSSVIVDSIPISHGYSAKWIVTIHDPVQLKTRTSEITAHHNSAGTVNFVEYGIIGSAVDASIDVVVDANAMKLTINSSCTHALEVDATRLSSCDSGFSTMISVDANQTASIDTLAQNKYKVFKWFLTVNDSATTQINSCEIIAHQDPTGNIQYSQYAAFGSTMSVTFSVQQQGSNVVLFINNNTTHNIIVDITRVSVIHKI